MSMRIGEEVQAVLRQDHAALTFAEPLKKTHAAVGRGFTPTY